jgi:DNA polymerase-3 subunit gamma/tau
VKLLVEVEGGVRLVSYRPGRIEFEPSSSAAADLAQRLGSRLQSWTGARWAVSVSASGGQPTIAETRDAEKARLVKAATETPIVAAILSAFPGARIGDLKTPEDIAATAANESLAEVEEEWDPFEEE